MKYNNASTILMLIAIVLLVFAAFGFNPFDKISTGWLGLAFACASLVVPQGA